MQVTAYDAAGHHGPLQYTAADMKAAEDEYLSSPLSLSTTAELYLVPKSTLAARVAARNNGTVVGAVGRPPKLSGADEKELGDWIRHRQDNKLPATGG